MIMYYEIQCRYSAPYSIMLDFLFLPRPQVTGTEIKCMEGYGNTFVFFPSCFWRAETASKLLNHRNYRRKGDAVPSGAFAAKRLRWQKLSETRGERTPAGTAPPAEMLIAKQRWEASEGSMCFKTTKKLLKNYTMRGVFPSWKTTRSLQVWTGLFCSQWAELCSPGAGELGWQSAMTGTNLDARMALKDKTVLSHG